MEKSRYDEAIITGPRMCIPLLGMWLRIFWIATRVAGSPSSFLRLCKAIVKLKRELVGAKPLTRLIKADNKYFWNMNAPAWPSTAFDRFFEFTLERIKQGQTYHGESVRFVMLSITKKCPMSCEHCFEWDEINKKETLSCNDLHNIIDKYIRLGASQFLLGGGEPLVRFDDLVSVIRSGSDMADFWISTSGYNLTEKKALHLKSAGLRGVAISLDHYISENHNAFRGHSQAFEHAVKASENARRAGLCIAFSICTTRSFITMENLFAYAELARNLGGGFIQILEPRSVGRYAGKDVLLSDEHYAILDEFYLKVNSEYPYKKLPTIIHTSYNQRKYGCDAAGLYSMMIDTDGYINACPFCRSKTAFALGDRTEDGISFIQRKGCFKFENRVAKSAIPL